MRLAYLINQYPRATDTFIQHEVGGLRTRGLTVLTYSVRRPCNAHIITEHLQSERANTHYLLPANLFLLLAANLTLFFTRPAAYLAGVRCAARMCPRGVLGALKQIAYWQEGVALAERLIRDRVDHLHNHFGDASGNVSVIAAAIAQLPFSISIHGPHIFFDPKQWAISEKLSHASFFRCISDFCKSQVQLFSDPDDWHKLKIVRCGVDLSVFSSTGNKGGARRILFVGRLAREKGLLTLLDALAVLSSKGVSFTADLVGDGEERTLIENYARTVGISESVAFLGFRSQAEIIALLRASDVFVLPSFAEGVPVSLMEAMALETAVITTNVGGVPELVVNDETGICVPPGNAHALADAMARLLDNDALRSRLQHSARGLVERRYNLERSLDQLANLFLETHAGAAVSPAQDQSGASSHNVVEQ